MRRMRKLGRRVLVLLALGALGATVSFAGEFKPYPNAQLDAKASQDATAAAVGAGLSQRSTIYTSTDSFEKVVAFYKPLATEIALPASLAKGVQLPDGRSTRVAWLAVDGAKSIAESKRWLAIQFPYVGSVGAGGKFQDIRDVTSITLTESK